jgi:hypothetical protein
VINALFEGGISLSDLFSAIGIDFLDFSLVKLRNFDGYMVFQLTPYFNVDKALKRVLALT